MALLPHIPPATRRFDPDHLPQVLIIARADHAASAQAVRVAALAMLHRWGCCREQALARGDFAVLTRCEDHLIWYELFLASLDNGATA